MKLLPQQAHAFQSPLDPALLKQKIEARVAPETWLGTTDLTAKPDAVYQGYVTDTGFLMQRISRARNSYRPVLCGRFEPQPAGTLVLVTLRLPRGSVVLVLFFLAILARFFYATLTAALAGTGPWIAVAVPTGMTLFVIGSVLVGFHSETDDEVAGLQSMIEGDEQPAKE